MNAIDSVIRLVYYLELDGFVLQPELCEANRPIDLVRSTEPVWSVLFRDDPSGGPGMEFPVSRSAFPPDKEDHR